MVAEQIVIEFDDLDTLVREHKANLSNGGTFARGLFALARGELCEVVLVHPNRPARMTLAAMVVWIVQSGDATGVGVAFTDFSPKMRDQLREFVETSGAPPAVDRPSAGSVHERMRGLNAAEAIRMARDGEVNERVVLERLYGKVVWEALLRNPRLTHPEVARIARMGALPRPLLEVIVENSSWLTGAQVRRALLSNPRLSSDLVQKVLRSMPKPELELVPKQTAYPASVRAIAQKKLKGP